MTSGLLPWRQPGVWCGDILQPCDASVSFMIHIVNLWKCWTSVNDPQCSPAVRETRFVNSLSPVVVLWVEDSCSAISAARSMAHKVAMVTVCKCFSFSFSLLRNPEQHLSQSIPILTYPLKRSESKAMASRFEGQVPFMVPLDHPNAGNP